MIKWVVGLVAAVVAVLISAPTPAAATPTAPVAAVYTYDGHNHAEFGRNNTAERGPPPAYDLSTTYYTVDRWSRGASAPGDPTARPNFDYDDLARFVRPTGGSPTAMGWAAGDPPGLSVVQGVQVAANAGRGALNLPFKDPALRSQVDDVVRHFDEFGAPPPGVAQGGLKEYPKGTYGNKNGALPSQPVGY